MIYQAVFTESWCHFRRKFWSKRKAEDFALNLYWLGDSIYIENRITKNKSILKIEGESNGK